MTPLGRWINLNDGREVNLHRSKAGHAVYLSRRKHVAVYDGERFGSNAVWFKLGEPLRKTVTITDPAVLEYGQTLNVYPDELFYTKEWRQWTLRWVAENGDQVGPAVYANTKAELYRIIRDEAKHYRITPAPEAT